MAITDQNHRIYCGLEFNRIDGDIAITEPNSREDFGIAALLDPNHEGTEEQAFQWDVRVLDPETCEVIASGSTPDLSNAKMFTAMALSRAWDMEDSKLVAV